MQPLFDFALAQIDSMLRLATIATLAAVVMAWAMALAWTLFDLRSRPGSIIRWWSVIPVAVLGPLGLPIYLGTRPLVSGRHLATWQDLADSAATLFSRCACGCALREDFRFCPMCTAPVADSCPSCSRLVENTFSACPFCATTLTPLAPAEEVPASPAYPAPRSEPERTPARALG